MIDFNIGNNIINGSEPLILGNPVNLIIQQVDMLFNTDINDVLGDENYGTNYDRYLYSTDISTQALESKVLNDLYKLDLFGFSPSVNITLFTGTQRDIALIDITFKGEYESFNKTYRIE